MKYPLTLACIEYPSGCSDILSFGLPRKSKIHNVDKQNSLEKAQI